jgi:hypothetical protein
MRTQLVRAAALTAGGLVLLLGWVVLGRQAAIGLRDSDRYTAAFADIACSPPPPIPRDDFLGEVQYLSNLPDRLPLTDETLAARLAAAFALHPLVESVERVEVLPRPVRVSLNYRTAVLAVPGPDALRTVDGRGILLPLTTSSEGFPRLAGAAVAPPAGSPGKPWGDDRVTAAARVAAYLQPFRDRVIVEKMTVEESDVLLFAAGARFRWGNPPGREARGEPDARTKTNRLCEIVKGRKPLLGAEYDLTAPAKAGDGRARP